MYEAMMQYYEFIGQVQNRARLGNEEEVVKTIRCVLETLGERLFSREAQRVAAQLPEEIGHYVLSANDHEKYNVDEFFERVTEKENVRIQDAVYHTRVVFEVLGEAISPGELDDLLDQLPEEFQTVFMAGSTGDLDLPR